MRFPLLLFTVFLLRSVAANIDVIPFAGLPHLELKNARAEPTTYRNIQALKMTEGDTGSGEALAIVKNVVFRDGSIEVDVAGSPSTNAAEQARGFIGVAFRMHGGGSRFEEFYIRPTNGRADDQLRRNHSTQYVSIPDWPWDRLRKESPGVYESYADIAAGEWTHLRIVVHGTSASLYVGGAPQPSLIVHDLKLGNSEGSVGLWIGPGTEGYFRNLKISAGR